MESLKNLLKQKKKGRGLNRPLQIYELFGVWNDRAKSYFGGKNIRCHPKFLRGKTLYVQVQGAALASELQLRHADLVKKINDHFGKKMVERIVFKL
ncbi:MAG: hypothetical protein A2722_04250 [Candidatus Doudnabacteria bacterium RIFCSPHIGHO2_01_FULL_50_11]|uniref:DUF721 domain-containing protein n=1 Tax=Candidatus Doudnabacteria bacterium RIFCSPHIGHO2_01_FULL_50_11 TaxID=1817828 RepID=A0A1F5PGA6_9BACT|nr:MAG: hypothetical protein A2722_04250 [Candidatus Doudnabacteria bacterium RIFCSPHIGHO2_01_FULL_50_11]HLC44931.1 DUF721 domain-containing protein [Patescibacteria group bacterium]